MKLYCGAASFTRWLGCAPQVIARVRPLRALEEHSPSPPRAGIVMPNGPMLRSSPSAAAPRTQRDSHLESAFGFRSEPGPTDAGLDEELTTWVFTKELVCGGMRSLTKRA